MLALQQLAVEVLPQLAAEVPLQLAAEVLLQLAAVVQQENLRKGVPRMWANLNVQIKRIVTVGMPYKHCII